MKPKDDDGKEEKPKSGLAGLKNLFQLTGGNMDDGRQQQISFVSISDEAHQAIKSVGMEWDSDSDSDRYPWMEMVLVGLQN